MKKFDVFICSHDTDLNSRVLQVDAVDEELAEGAAKLAINVLWPDAFISRYTVIQRTIPLDMLEPSMN